jgi:tRNA-specific 2-thiouridylase
MRIWNAEDSENPIADCPWKIEMDDTRNVCEKLCITFEVINMIYQYRTLVVKELVDGDRNAISPNPDVLCNAHVKFGLFSKIGPCQWSRKLYNRALLHDDDKSK